LIPPNTTPAVARAIEAALDLACRQGASEVQAEHVLLCLLSEEEGRAAVLLAAAGLSSSTIRAKLEVNASPTEYAAAEAPPSLSAGVQRILDRARALAGEFSADRLITSDHMVLALVQMEDSLRSRLEDLGLRVAQLEAEVGSSAAPLPLDEPLSLSEPTEQIDTARILDASANRAREALRVVEDYCRFSLDDAFLSGRLKQLRHDLAEALALLPPGWLLEGRDTLADVGTNITTSREQERYSITAVVLANWKRLQEAFRSLEEYGKLHSPRLGRALEKLRYRSYTLERAIFIGSSARERLAGAQLQVLVTGSLCKASLDWTIQEAAAGGASIIQLREKDLSDRELLERARRVRAWTAKAGVLFIVNDRPDVARLAEADGVHVGQDELTVKDARRIVGPNALIGVSTHSVAQARQAVLDSASYIGVGPVFPSATKVFSELPGEELVRQVTAETSIPEFAIGGVNLETIERAIAAGARRVAVSQAICQAHDPRAVAARLTAALRSAVDSLKNPG